MTVELTSSDVRVTLEGTEAESNLTVVRAPVIVEVVNATPGGGGVTDHGALTGLADDDHKQYQRADAVFTATSPYTITDESLLATAGSAVTLPDAEDNVGREFTIASAAQTVSISTAGSDTIFGVGSSYSLRVGNQVTFVAINIAGSWGYGVTGRNGDAFHLPAWFGQSIADGRVVTMSSGVPAWVEPSVPETADPRAWVTEAFADELDTTTALWMRCYPTAASMDGDYGGTWQITNAGTGTGTLPATPDGIDIRAKFYLYRPYEDSELAGSGQDWPYQRYREILTQTKASATGGDLSEWAVVHPDETFSGLSEGVAAWFWESTLTGAAGEGAGFFADDSSQLIGVPLIARLTLDTATETVTQWRWVPYDTGATGVEQTDDGYWWEPVDSETDARFASMDPNGTETWKIGIQNRMDVAWMTAHEFGGSKILDIQPSHLTTAGAGATSFTDGVGNTISTTDGTIAIPQALNAAKVTSGVFPPARLGTGTPTSFTFLNGLGEWTYDVPVFVPVKNTTASTIAKGAPVYATGTVGATSTIEIAPADADDAAKMPAIGLTETSLSANATGFVIVVGTLRGVDTNAYSINAPLYVSTTAGQLTSTKPTGTSDAVQMIGLVTRVNANNGEILVLAQGADEVPNAIDAGKITSGTLATARLGSGTASSSTYLRGDQTYARPVVNAYYVTGRYYYPPSVVGGGTRALASGAASATPYPIYQAVSVDGLQIDLSAATASGQTIDLHVMTANASGDPDASVFTVTVTTTGSGTQVLSTTTTAVALTPGLYYVVAHNTSANSLTSRSAAAACHIAPMPAASASTANGYSGWLKSPGTGAITSYPAVTAITDNVNQSPLVAMRFA
jgi:hypothetical protein